MGHHAAIPSCFPSDLLPLPFLSPKCVGERVLPPPSPSSSSFIYPFSPLPLSIAGRNRLVPVLLGHTPFSAISHLPLSRTLFRGARGSAWRDGHDCACGRGFSYAGTLSARFMVSLPLPVLPPFSQRGVSLQNLSSFLSLFSKCVGERDSFPFTHPKVFLSLCRYQKREDTLLINIHLSYVYIPTISLAKGHLNYAQSLKPTIHKMQGLYTSHQLLSLDPLPSNTLTSPSYISPEVALPCSQPLPLSTIQCLPCRVCILFTTFF